MKDTPVFALLGAFLLATTALADTPCAPVQTFVYKLKPGQEKSLQCSGSPTKIFDVTVPARGLALAEVLMVMANSPGHATHFWSIGAHVGEGIIHGNIGDDIASGGNTGRKRVLGYGELTDAKNHVVVKGRQGSTLCSNGAVTVWSGARLRVWVEDPHPACRGKDIVAMSYKNNMKAKGFVRPRIPNFVWPVGVAGSQDLAITMSTTSDRRNLIVTTAVEGSVDKTISKLSAGLTIDNGLYRVQQTQWVPHSEGMGHLVLNPIFSTVYAPPHGEPPELPLGDHTITHFVRNMSTSVKAWTLPNCCGDSVLGAVRLP